MRGADITQESLFTVAKLDDFVPVNHPLRAIRKLANTALQRMSALFDTLYADTGRTSIAPEKLMRAQLLQLLYSLRSERMLMEQLGYNLLFAGSSAWPLTTRCGITRCSRRTVTASMLRPWPPSF